jgi:hypothetical protein
VIRAALTCGVRCQLEKWRAKLMSTTKRSIKPMHLQSQNREPDTTLEVSHPGVSMGDPYVQVRVDSASRFVVRGADRARFRKGALKHPQFSGRSSNPIIRKPGAPLLFSGGGKLGYGCLDENLDSLP